MDTIKTLVKYTLIGIGAAFLVLYFSQGGFKLANKGVTISEVSVDDALKLADEDRNARIAMPSFSNAVKQASPAVVNINTAKLVAQQRPKLYDDPFFQFFFG